MVLFFHELRRNRRLFWIWTLVAAFFVAACIALYPEIRGQMEAVSGAFSSMGALTQAFGMDKVDFGVFTGYYAVEITNILGLGGAMYAAMVGASALAGEEKDGTAEFLLTQPVSRGRVYRQKALALFFQIILMNGLVCAAGVAMTAAIDEVLQLESFCRIHIAFLLMDLEIGAICLGLSPFMRRGSMGIGLGVAVIFYFMGIARNLTDKVEFLRYITPNAYAEGAEIVAARALHWELILLGLIYGLVLLLIGAIRYRTKDIR